jgi:hypothetical protein
MEPILHHGKLKGLGNYQVREPNGSLFYLLRSDRLEGDDLVSGQLGAGTLHLSRILRDGATGTGFTKV